MENEHKHVVEQATSPFGCLRIVDENLEHIDVVEFLSRPKSQVHPRITSCNLV